MFQTRCQSVLKLVVAIACTFGQSCVASHLDSTPAPPPTQPGEDFPALVLISAGDVVTMGAEVGGYELEISSKFIADFLDHDDSVFHSSIVEQVAGSEFISVTLILKPTAQSQFDAAFARLSAEPLSLYVAGDGKTVPPFIILKVDKALHFVLITSTSTTATSTSTTSSFSTPSKLQPTTVQQTTLRSITTIPTTTTLPPTPAAASTALASTLLPSTLATTTPAPVTSTATPTCFDAEDAGITVTNPNTGEVVETCELLASRVGCNHVTYGMEIQSRCPLSCGKTDCTTSPTSVPITSAPTPAAAEAGASRSGNNIGIIVFLVILVLLILVALVLVAHQIHRHSRKGQLDIGDSQHHSGHGHGEGIVAPTEYFDNDITYNYGITVDTDDTGPNVVLHSQSSADNERRRMEMMMGRYGNEETSFGDDTFERLQDAQLEYNTTEESRPRRSVLDQNVFAPPSPIPSPDGPPLEPYAKAKLKQNLTKMLCTDIHLESGPVLFTDADFATMLTPTDMTDISSEYYEFVNDGHPGLATSAVKLMQAISDHGDRSMSVLSFINTAKEVLKKDDTHTNANERNDVDASATKGTTQHSSHRTQALHDSPGYQDGEEEEEEEEEEGDEEEEEEEEEEKEEKEEENSNTDFVENPRWSNVYVQPVNTGISNETYDHNTQSNNHSVQLNDHDIQSYDHTQSNDHDTQSNDHDMYSEAPSTNKTVQNSKWVHYVEKKEGNEGKEWATKYLENDGDFVVRSHLGEDPNLFVLSVMYRRRVTSHQVGIDGEDTVINLRSYGTFDSIDEVISALSSTPLPLDTLMKRPWPVLLRRGYVEQLHRFVSSDPNTMDEEFEDIPRSPTITVEDERGNTKPRTASLVSSGSTMTDLDYLFKDEDMTDEMNDMKDMPSAEI